MLVYAWLLSLQSRLEEDRGATAVEYGLLVGLIAVVIVVAVTAFGNQIATMFDNMRVALGGAAT